MHAHSFRRRRSSRRHSPTLHPSPAPTLAHGKQPTSARPTIPVIDLADDDATVAAALRRACCDTGFFMLSPSSHGIAPALIDAMFDQTRALFSLPLVDKLVLLKVPPSGGSGDASAPISSAVDMNRNIHKGPGLHAARSCST